MGKYFGNTIISHIDAKVFNNEITRAINKFEKVGASWEIQYRPLMTNDGKIVFTALIMYTKED